LKITNIVAAGHAIRATHLEEIDRLIGWPEISRVTTIPQKRREIAVFIVAAEPGRSITSDRGGQQYLSS